MPPPPPASVTIPFPIPQNPKRLTVNTLSPVTHFGSYECDRIIKQGPVLKRTRRTKSWKPIHIVLRANQLSIYKNEKESKLRHAINLSDLTAVARQKDPKRQSKHVFGLFSPSRNFHLEAATEQEAQEWVEAIRLQARMDQKEEEMYLASPGGGASTNYRGFERSIDAHISPTGNDVLSGYSSSDVEALNQSQPLPRARHRGSLVGNRKSSAVDYSGAEHGSYSDFSDWGGPSARLSALSLSHQDPRPSTSSTQPMSSVYGQAPGRPSMGVRTASMLSGLNEGVEDAARKQNMSASDDPERVICHGWIYLLKSTSGVRQWKKVWMVLRPKQLTIYKNEEEYTALIVLPFPSIIDAVEIDDISKSKTACMQILSEERNYRFCAMDEDSLARWLGAFKSLLSKRKAAKTGAMAAPPT